MYLVYKDQITQIISTVILRYLKSCCNGFSEKNVQVLLWLLAVVCMHVSMYLFFQGEQKRHKPWVDNGKPEQQSWEKKSLNLILP